MDRPIVLTGGTGLIGGELLRRLAARGTPTRALVRRPGKLADVAGCEELAWDGVHPPDGALDGAGALVHLSGEPVFGGLPTAERRARLHSSRVDSTHALVEAMGALPAERRPDTFVCASAVGYYGDRGEEVLEESAAPGSGLLAELCVDWEAAAAAAAGHGVRVCSIRIGVVLSADGGALPLMSTPFKLGVGGRLGDGRQWFPWIHQEDVVGMLLAALDSPDWSGAVNAVAPNPVRNAELTKALGRVLRRPTILPVPAFAVRAALGDLSGELLGSKRVVPARAQALGYAFRFDALEPALREELRAS